jgi:hypothetical protein
MRATTGTSGIIEGDMSEKNSQQKLGTTRRSPKRSRTARVFGISRNTAKSERAGEWGGWGRLSEDGPGQKNPARSEDPWGAGYPGPTLRCRMVDRPSQTQNWFEGAIPPARRMVTNSPSGACMRGARLNARITRQVPSETHIFQPYWGKPAVRNDRGDGGDVGIIRSPVRATILLD